jgi:D-arabinose 1-dehydrogenase-like Zn-dependent alcohol dehydrogenase
VVTGATSGHLPAIDLRRIYFLQLEIVGSTMGTREELSALMSLMVSHGIRPVVDGAHGFTQAREAFEHLAKGEVFGKIVLDHTR